jgi:predicted transposase/invertase (TIGR01784 family)
LDKIEKQGMRANLMAATAVFAGLVMAPEMIKTILRSDIMKESAFYQEILQEGRLEGRLEGERKGRLEGERKGRLEGEREGKLKVGQQLLQLGMSLSQVAQVTGFSEQELQQRLSG